MIEKVTIIKIIEVLEVLEPKTILNKRCGEIIQLPDKNGLYVACKKGSILQILVMSSDAGVLSGEKYIRLGIHPGHYFTSNQH